MNDFEKSQAAKIASYYNGNSPSSDDFIQKGGEGSKGGKVIGHTKSGKPVYDKKGHASYKDFNINDHEDAMDLHRLEAKKHPLWSNKQRLHENTEANEKHDDISDYHYKKFKALQNGTKTYKEGATKESRGM